MTELGKKIWKVLQRPQTAALATISRSGAPWVRYVTIRAEKDFTLNFCTGHSTRKAREIPAHPVVHVTCGNLNPPDGSVYLQVAGRAEVCADAATKAKYWQEGWKRYFKGPEDPDYVIVLVRPDRIEYNGSGAQEAEVWTREQR